MGDKKDVLLVIRVSKDLFDKGQRFKKTQKTFFGEAYPSDSAFWRDLINRALNDYFKE